ncbi:MAG TPA: sigma-54-dependent Fis family transcriptional regulator, partial [Pseudomonas sp.]|nr:sigma-54-dependent Fis family transcriptional regulator [Pseudomonas sp.]
MTDAVQERVLLVEDDDSLRQLLVEELEDRGLQVRALASAEEAVGSLESWEPALVVSDLRLPGADGMALLRRVKSMQAAPAFLVITAFGSIQQAVAALKEGAD